MAGSRRLGGTFEGLPDDLGGITAGGVNKWFSHGDWEFDRRSDVQLMEELTLTSPGFSFI